MVIDVVASDSRSHSNYSSPSAIAGEDANNCPEHMVDVHATWALVHGLSGLLNNDFLSPINKSKKQREEAVRQIIVRYWSGR